MKFRAVLLLIVFVLVVSAGAYAVSAQTLSVDLLPPQATALSTVPISTSTVLSGTAVLSPTLPALSPTTTPAAVTNIPLSPEDVTFNPYGLGNKIQGVVVAATPYDNSEPPGPVGAPSSMKKS